MDLNSRYCFAAQTLSLLSFLHTVTLHSPKKHCLKTVLFIKAERGVFKKRNPQHYHQWCLKKRYFLGFVNELDVNLSAFLFFFCLSMQHETGRCSSSAPLTAVNEAQVVRRWRSEGIHSSVVFHLAGNRGCLTAVEGLWRLEELATDQKFISLSPGLAPKVCERQKAPWSLSRHHWDASHQTLKVTILKVIFLFLCWHLKRSLTHCVVSGLHFTVTTCQSKSSGSGVMSSCLDFSVDKFWTTECSALFCLQPWWLLLESQSETRTSMFCSR